MENMAWDGPKWGRELLFPASPDLADILGDMDYDFENRRLGGESKPGNLNGSCERDSEAGVLEFD